MKGLPEISAVVLCFIVLPIIAFWYDARDDAKRDQLYDMRIEDIRADCSEYTLTEDYIECVRQLTNEYHEELKLEVRDDDGEFHRNP